MTIDEYLNEHNLTQELSKALNACVKSKEQYPLVYISKYLVDQTPAEILEVRAGYLYDNHGLPTTYVDVRTHKGVFRGTSPTGYNTSIHELQELRDDDPSAFHGKGVLRAVYFINERIAPLLIGKDPREQSEIDGLIRKLSKYSNVLYPLSVAVCKAGAREYGVSVEDHLRRNDLRNNQSDRNERYILKYFSSSLFEVYLVSESLQMLAEIPVVKHFESPEEALVAMSEFSNVGIGINMNASEFLTEDNHYMPNGEQKLSRDEMIDMYFNWTNEFHSLVFIEDPFDQDDVAAFNALKETLKDTQCFVLGTNIYASRTERVRPCADAIALKPSAAGTVTLALETAKRATENGLTVVVSGRTGDVTAETFETEFARGISAGYIRQNRMEKFN